MRDIADRLDRAFRAGVARAALGISPAALVGAYLDWGMHLLSSPGRQQWLAWKAHRKFLRFAHWMANSAIGGGLGCIDPLPADHRFSSPAWERWPFNAFSQAFLLCQQWLHNATTNVPGVEKSHEAIVEFTTRQLFDIAAPSNFFWTNPAVLGRTFVEGGMNLRRGASNYWADIAAGCQVQTGSAERPSVGQTVAITPGKVVFRNRLIELLQYEPTTESVCREPVLIVPAWIMKYYILDLTPDTSLVRFLVSRGFTVFMISWINPDAGYRDTGMADYLAEGVMAALDAVTAITKAPAVHGVGYCLGGTLASIAAAAMARDGDARLGSLSLLAAQQDFAEAGELTLFTSESQIALLEDMMSEQGYLDTRQMAGAFQLLRSNDLIWSHAIEAYLLGERPEPTELMRWNADATRMPARMHSEYLRGLFLQNDLAEGRYRVGAAPVAIRDIRIPIFAVGTRADHIAPWRSVHKIHLLTEAEITFVLTAGGHDAGIVSEPGHQGRCYGWAVRPAGGHFVAPDAWEAGARSEIGSWWPSWADWLARRSTAGAAPPPIGSAEYPALGNAPGTYVFRR